MAIKDLTGQKFGKLIVLSLNGRNSANIPLWKCQCECGNFKETTSDHLKSGNTRSCGCLVKFPKKRYKDYSDFLNQKINKLTILSVGNPTKHGHSTFLCRCECGIEKEIEITRILNNRVISCGCFRIEVIKKLIGPKHHNWNPYKSEEDREYDSKYRKNKEWPFIKWRNSVYKRDNYTCQICKKKGGKLNAHHLNCWADFINERYVIENGICLCKECHNIFHSKYGLKTTRSMFEEWQKSVI